MKPGSTKASPASTTGALEKPDGAGAAPVVTCSTKPSSSINTRPEKAAQGSSTFIGITRPATTSAIELSDVEIFRACEDRPEASRPSAGFQELPAKANRKANVIVVLPY